MNKGTQEVARKTASSREWGVGFPYNFVMMAAMSDETKKATIEWAGPDLFIGTSASGHAVVFDTDSVRSSAPSPMEMLLLSLGSCTGVDVVSILQKKRAKITGYRVEIKAVRRDEHPRSYRQITVHHVLRGTGLTEKHVAQAVKLSDEKYCSVAATLRPTANIISSFEIIDEAA
jgi:putative redox protein